MAPFNKPMSGLVTPRFGGIATFMRLPHVPLDQAQGVDIGLVGIPWDGGTTNRPGPRHAPRQMRDMSSMVRPMASSKAVDPRGTKVLWSRSITSWIGTEAQVTS